MKTVVYQSYRTFNVPGWLTRCMASVAKWAEEQGFDYHFVDDRLFEYAPDWYRERTNHDKLLVSDLARLEVARELLASGYERTVWVDADVLVFNPEHFVIDTTSEYAFCREVWLTLDLERDRAITCIEQVNNAVTVFTRGNSLLEFYIYAIKALVADPPRPIESISASTLMLGTFNQQFRLPLITSVGLFSPIVSADLVSGDGQYVRAYIERFGSPLGAANFCSSWRNREYKGVVMTDAMFDAMIDRLLETRGEAINQYLWPAPPAHTPQIRIDELRLAASDQRLSLARLDAPQPGAQVGGRGLEFAGCVRGRDQQVTMVEALCEGRVVARALPVGPGVEGCEQGAFRGQVLLGGAGSFDIELRAVLDNRRTLPLASLRALALSPDPDEDLPLVSVIITGYRQAHFIGEAIESALAQSYRSVEVIVVDDGSPDNTGAVAARYPGLRYIWQRNQERAVARNAGLRACQGEFVIFLDGDDRLLPEAIARNLPLLRADPGCALASGVCRLIGEDGASIPMYREKPPARDSFKALLSHSYIWPPAVAMFRASAVRAVGGFDPNPAFTGAEDLDLYLRIARQFATRSHDEEVAEYRRHAQNSTGRLTSILKANMAVMQAHERHTRWSPEYRAAHADGLRRCLRVFGDDLARNLRGHVGAGQWRAAIPELVTLARHSPRRLATLVERTEVPNAGD